MVNFSSFLFAQIDKIFENFVRPDEYLQHQCILILFPIIYTCIYFNPPMNPLNLEQSFYPVGVTIALAIYLLYYILINLYNLTC